MEKDNLAELNVSEIENYLQSHKGEIIDFIQSKIGDYQLVEIKNPRDIHQAMINELMRDVPYGTMIQLGLASALIYSLWCGQRSQILVNDSQTGFKEEHAEEIQKAIIKAYNIGRNYASERPS
jgi:hypothetical protein